MIKKATPSESAVGAQAADLANREATFKDREELIRLREDAVRAREEAVVARGEAAAASQDRDRLLVQMRDANEQLVLATIRADQLFEREQTANRAKDEFLAILGHELRNPLAPIATSLDLMALRGPTMFEEERSVIGRQVKHLVRLVDDLLDVARITEGKIELARQPLELAGVVAEAVEMVSPLFESKNHHVAVNVASRGLVVNADPARLAQIISNLLMNSAKYTPAGGSITVTAKREGLVVALSVRDTGIGLSSELLPRVFDRFVQERQAIDRARGGLGLGLAIVRSLVILHGGKVTAHSEGTGTGSEFVVELPAAAEPQVDTAAPVAEKKMVKARRILVVDDNHDIAEMTATVLTMRGHQVRIAYDGPSALEVVKEFTPEVALLDIGLPVMDGYELAAALRAALTPHTVRMIAISGYGQEGDRRRSDEAGFDLHLVKPVPLKQLLSSIEPPVPSRAGSSAVTASATSRR